MLNFGELSQIGGTLVTIKGVQPTFVPAVKAFLAKQQTATQADKDFVADIEAFVEGLAETAAAGGGKDAVLLTLNVNGDAAGRTWGSISWQTAKQ